MNTQAGRNIFLTTGITSSRGFTLIELLVVISLISMVLFITIPRLQDNPFLDKKRKASLWIMGTVRALKQKSVHERKDYTLHIDIDTGKLWVSNESMTAEALLEAEQNGYAVPDEFRIQDIEFPGQGKFSLGRSDIHFSKKGYSDMAFIHAELSDGSRRSFLIEPFLPGVKLYEENISFNQ